MTHLIINKIEKQRDLQNISTQVCPIIKKNTVINKLKKCLIKNNHLLIKIFIKDLLKDIQLEITIIKEEIIIIISIMMVKMIIKETIIIIIIEEEIMTFMIIETIIELTFRINIKIREMKVMTHLVIEMIIMKDLEEKMNEKIIIVKINGLETKRKIKDTIRRQSSMNIIARNKYKKE